MSRDELLNAVLSLPRGDRAQLARELLRSLGEDLSEEEWNEAWGQELDKRIAAMEAGERGVSFGELLNELEQVSDRKAS